eukprot:gnl/Carplike_NY0171/5139_a7012_266.p1 GENE.gnl/Carplike_NY0171/5139_a7012_266~~gnl/Carplike_NY0171/5139_a7012_266.p1  ORF type:complete len:147 (+),score=31.12 gnl/Carplike_NY0171/5139_a7012_266:336-776(+)
MSRMDGQDRMTTATPPPLPSSAAPTLEPSPFDKDPPNPFHSEQLSEHGTVSSSESPDDAAMVMGRLIGYRIHIIKRSSIPALSPQIPMDPIEPDKPILYKLDAAFKNTFWDLIVDADVKAWKSPDLCDKMVRMRRYMLRSMFSKDL